MQIKSELLGDSGVNIYITVWFMTCVVSIVLFIL